MNIYWRAGVATVLSFIWRYRASMLHSETTSNFDKHLLLSQLKAKLRRTYTQVTLDTPLTQATYAKWQVTKLTHAELLKSALEPPTSTLLMPSDVLGFVHGCARGSPQIGGGGGILYTGQNSVIWATGLAFPSPKCSFNLAAFVALFHLLCAWIHHQRT